MIYQSCNVRMENVWNILGPTYIWAVCMAVQVWTFSWNIKEVFFTINKLIWEIWNTSVWIHIHFHALHRWKDDRSPSCRYCAKVVSNVSRNIGRNTTHLTEYVKDWQWSMWSFLQFSGQPLLWHCPAGKPDTHSTNSQLSSSESCDLISLRLKLCLTQPQNAQTFPQNPNATT